MVKGTPLRIGTLSTKSIKKDKMKCSYLRFMSGGFQSVSTLYEYNYTKELVTKRVITSLTHS